MAYTNRVKLLRRLQTGGKNGFTCPRPKVLTFEYAAQNLKDQKLPRQMDTLTEGEQPVENYEMVRSMYSLYTHFKLQFTKKINIKGLQYKVNIGLFLYHVIVHFLPKKHCF